IFFDEVTKRTANLPLNNSSTDYSFYDETGLPANEGASRRVITGRRLVRLRPGITYTLRAKRSYNRSSYCSNPNNSGCFINNNGVIISFSTPIKVEVPPTSSTIIENIAGGLRIKRKTDKGNAGSPAMVTDYGYRLHDSGGDEVNTSSGVILTKPDHYYTRLFNYSTGGGACNGCGLFSVSGCYQQTMQVYAVFNIDSDVPLPLGSTQGSHIGYREVRVSRSGNGYSIYKYTSPYDYPDVYPALYKSAVWAAGNEFTFERSMEFLKYLSPFIPSQAFDWKRGLLDSVVQYDNSKRKIFGERNYYTFHNNSSEIRGINVFYSTIDNKFDYISSKEASYIDYKISSGWPALIKKTISNDGDNAVFKTITYEYASPNHIQPTTIIESTSDGKSVVHLDRYSADKPSDTQTPVSVLNEMVDNKHILYAKIKSESRKNGVLAKGEQNNYRLENGQALLSSAAVANGTVYENRREFTKYDALGNLLSISEDGLVSHFIWSYNSMYPIAKIQNAEYSKIEELLNGRANIEEFSRRERPTDEDVRLFLLPLRAPGVLKGAAIITFTYEPLVGMTSQTDRRGSTTYYGYDNLQRLLWIKNENLELLKEYHYNYKP
ncbi:hypothetical protein, partial [Arcticibacter sp.]|uniref:hypothetical protein n=1 Tax=Arcticibacter sp. TaxID=1872630 RepID=UPI00388E139A